MSNIEICALREELSNPAIGSNAHLRKLALALLDELEAKDNRIAELEAREVTLPKVQDIHPLGPQSAKVLCEFHRNIVNRCADEIRKIGVKVSIKGD